MRKLYVLPHMPPFSYTLQGAWFDPPSFTPLANNSALAAALAVLRELAQFAPPALPTDSCATPDAMVQLFRAGGCAMMLGHRVFKARNQNGRIMSLSLSPPPPLLLPSVSVSNS